jgi:hypothetical protein
VASSISLRTPSGSPSFTTSIFALEHASKTLMRKVRSPLSQVPSSFASKLTRRTDLDASSDFSTSDVEGSGSVIFHLPEIFTTRLSSAGVVKLREAVVEGLFSEVSMLCSKLPATERPCSKLPENRNSLISR